MEANDNKRLKKNGSPMESGSVGENAKQSGSPSSEQSRQGVNGSSVAESKSANVSDSKPASDDSLTISEALELTIPTVDDGIAAARNYVGKIHPLIKQTEGSLTELVARIGMILLAYRNSDHGAHGKWGRFLKDNFPLSERTARNYMQVALETTAEDRAGKQISEVYEMIGVISRPGERVKSRFLAQLDKVEESARSCVEHVHKIATEFEQAIDPYDGSNRDIGGHIALRASALTEQLDLCVAAAETAQNSIAAAAASKAPQGEQYIEEEVGSEQVRHKKELWADLPEGTTEQGKALDELACCEKEAVMQGIGKSSGKCRECGKKIRRSGK